MPRIARIVLPKRPHLVAQRGNRSERLFYSTNDRQTYLEILSASLDACRVKLWSYRLDAREVFLVLVPPDAEGLGRALRNAHGTYSQFVNRRQETTGHLFHARFYSCPLDAEHLALAVRYLERFTGRIPSETRSSTPLHCRPGAGRGILAAGLPLLRKVPHWQNWLGQGMDKAAVTYLLARLRLGKPAGSKAFVKQVEEITGLNLSRPRGRPRKVSE